MNTVQVKTAQQTFEAYDSNIFDLIPLDGKAPRDKNWTTRTYDSAKIRRAAIKASFNVGVRLKPTQLVIDIDPRNGGLDSFDRFCIDHGLDDSLFPRVVTGSGGLHLYMTKPADVPIRKSLKEYPGIDFLSRGAQVVAAGSIHPGAKKPYKWDDNFPDVRNGLPALPASVLEAITRPASESSGVGGEYSPEQIGAMLDALDPADFRDHSAWLKLMQSCHHASGGDAREEFIEWSVSDPEYSDQAEMIGKRWDSLHEERDDAVTAASLRYELERRGLHHIIPAADASGDFDAIDDDEDDDIGDTENTDDSWLEGGDALVPVEARGLKLNRYQIAPDTFENALCAVVKTDLRPAWNELKQCVEFRAQSLPWPEGYGRILTDHTLRLVRLFFLNQFQGVAYQPGKDHLLEAVMTVAYQAKFSPVLEYLDSLQWDGVTRVESIFSAYFGCRDDAYTRAVSRCFMIGAVRRQRSPGSKFDTLPVLRSPQGWGKSSAVRLLFGRDWYSDADMGNLRDKDATLKLRGVWVQEFAEIESLTRAETGVLKAFCSRATDRQRDPYDRLVKDEPRRLVFIATVNEGGYLKDATGARRFWPLEVRSRIDLAKIEQDRNQLWAEAAIMEARGDSDVLPSELWGVAAKRQAEQTSDDPWGDTLATFLEQRTIPPANEDDDEPRMPPNRVHTSELFDALNIKASDQSRDKAQRLRTVMEATLGWRHASFIRVLGRGGKGYVRRAGADADVGDTH